MRTMPRGTLLLAGILLASALVACGGDSPTVGDVDPVPLGVAAPTYALASKRGLVVRSGDVRRTFAGFDSAEWLPGGNALLHRGWGVRGIWHPATDEVTSVRLGDPNRSVTQISLVEPEHTRANGPYRLVAYDLDGTEQWRVDLPEAEVAAEDAEDVQRQYKTAHTVDGTTFLSWYDNSELEEYDDYGILRVGPGGDELEQVQEGTPVVALWLAADGSALLATRRVSGDPCGGCQVTQQLIEIDADDGSTIATYSLPEEYDEGWDVREVDKVGSSIAVRFEETEFGRPDQDGDWDQWVEQRGTWVLDADGWSMVEDSDEEISWWQGPDDRIVAVPLPRERDRFIGGDEFTYWWEHDGERTRLRGLSRLDAGRRFYEASIPGQLLPPG